MKRIFFLLGISLIIGFFNSVYSQQLVTWGNLANATVTNNVLVKTSEGDGWNAGAESKNMLAFGQDGWVEFELQEVTKKKAIGLTYEQSSGVAMDSIKCGFIFDFSGTTRVLYTRKLGTNTNIGTYDLNDVFRIEKVGTKVLFLKNGSKIDSCTLSSNTNSFFVDASIYTSGGQFHQVMTSLSVLDSLNVNPDKDAVVISSNSSINYGTHAYFWAYKGTNKATFTYRSLMEFSVSSIPPNAKIASAKLYLYGVDGDSPTQWGHRCETNCVSNSSKLYLNTALWTETTVTWDNKPNYTTSVFATLPASPSSVYDYSDYTVDIKDLVKNWVDGSYTNNGFTFMLNNESYYYTALQFRSSDHTNSSERPRVEIKYYIGTNYYVNDNSTTGDVFCKATGDASNSGLSPYSPKASVSSILSTYVLGAKDTIFVDAGSYSEAITFNNTDYGTSAGNLVLYGAGKDKTVFTAPSATNTLTFTYSSYVSVENISFSSSQNSYYDIRVMNSSNNIVVKNDSLYHSQNSNLHLEACSSIIVENCKFYNTKTDVKQIYLIGSCNNIRISSNILHNSAHKSIGIYAAADEKGSKPRRLIVENNNIFADSIGCAFIGTSTAYIDSVRINENIINIISTDSLASAIQMHYTGSSSNSIDSIFNNRFIGGRYGMWVNYLNYSRVFNNYFLDNKYGIKLTSSTANFISYNSFYNERINFWGTTSDIPTNSTLSNNVFYSNGSSSYQNLYLAGGNKFTAADYNDYYTPNGALVSTYNSTNYDTLGAWQGVCHSVSGNGDEHSISDDPKYLFTLGDTAYSQHIEDNLLLWYPMNGNCDDASGNGFDASAINADLTTDRFGNANSAYQFNGTDQYIDWPYSTTLQPSLPLTISYWVKFDNFTTPYIFDSDFDQNNYSGFWMNLASSKMSVNYGDNTHYIGPADRRTLLGTSVLQTGVWYFIVGVIEGPTNMKIYINGKDDGGTYSGTGGSLAYASVPGSFGRIDGNMNGSAYYFAGSLDDFRFWDRALSSSEVLELYRSDLDIDLFSPCTQAGSTISGISADINGRVRRSLPSIGAMEPELQVYIVTSLLDSVPGGVDSVVVDISGSGIDTSIFIKEDISLFPEIPTDGNTRLFIEFRTDTSAFDTTIYIVSLDAQGKIDSMLTVIDGEEIVLDSSYYTIYSERVLVLQNPEAGILFPNPVEIETSLEGGFILSPDQDGLYDTLRVSCSDYDTYSVVIYNEYGELVDSFEVSPATPNAYWDGKDSSNEYVNPGSYYFELIIEEVGYKYPFCVKY